MARPMAARNTRLAPVRMNLEVEETTKVVFFRIADRAGMSGAQLFEALVAHARNELTDRGVPSWLPQPLAADGELPIEAA